MAATVFLAESLPAPGQEYLLAGDEGRHAAAVRRVRTGEELVLSDGAGGFARCTAVAVGKADVTVRCSAAWTVPPASPLLSPPLEPPPSAQPARASPATPMMARGAIQRRRDIPM